MAKRKMILDLDTGVDDALVIAYALADPEVDLIGIVSSYGNNLLDICAENSLKMEAAGLLGHTDIPVCWAYYTLAPLTTLMLCRFQGHPR